MSKKIIIVKQQDAKDCGVSCLSSIIRYYGGYVPFERLRLDTFTTNDGTTAFNILNAAKKYGFAIRGLFVNNLELSNIKLPAIAHLNYKNGYKHFVVLYNIYPSKVVLMDPARGKVVMKRKEFEEVFSKVLLMFYPQTKITVFKKEDGLEKIIKGILKQEKKLLFRIFIISFILCILSIISSYYFKINIDNINNKIDNLHFLGLIFLIVLVFKVVFCYLRLYLENKLAKRIDLLLYKEFFSHLYFLPLLSISSRNSGDIITRVKELNNLKNIIIEVFSEFLLNLVFMLIVSPFLIIINYHLFLILCCSILLYLIIIILNKNKIYQKSYANLSKEEDFNSYLIETINCYESIKNLNVTDYIFNRVLEKRTDYTNEAYNMNSFLNKLWSEKYLINEITVFLIYSFGFTFIIRNELSITNLVTYVSLMFFFLEPIKNMLDIIPRMNYIKATITKTNEFISISKERMNYDNNKIFIASINVINLEFAYDDYNLVIKNKSFVIKEGTNVLLKGESGCGKSSFCKILLKYYNNYKGIIKIGNTNIRDISLLNIRKNIIYVSQNERLFNDTIKNNLLIGRDISREKINTILEICLLEKVLNKKNFDLDTIISNDDNYFSGGEKQRIILARALLKESKIIILDEALSEVDYDTERKIINNIKKYYSGKTIIYITHKNQDDLFDNIIYF